MEIDRLENKIRSLSEMAVNRQEPEFISSEVNHVASSMIDTEKTMNELQFATGLNPVDNEPPELSGRRRRWQARGIRWLDAHVSVFADGLVILHEDRDILVVDKPAGLLTIGTERDKSHTAYFILTDYVRKGFARSRNRVFIVHRLDRDTSGVLVFAKSEAAKLRLQGEWSETEKKYLAVVHGQCRKSEETITTYLAENKAHVMYSTPDPAKGKLSRTAYQSAQTNEGLCLAGSGLADGQEEPDPGASRRYRTSDCGR